jgi:hypothetical protein
LDVTTTFAASGGVTRVQVTPPSMVLAIPLMLLPSANAA